MAKIVLGLGTSHTPQLSVPWEKWDLLREKDETDPRLDYQSLLRKAPPGLEKELTPEKWRSRYEACRKSLDTLSRLLADSSPEVIVIIGDDQHEQFLDDNMPMFCIYRGEKLLVKRRMAPDSAWAMFEDGLPETPREYPSHPGLANHLIHCLVDAGFDVACSNHMREEVGLGHAFTFLYRRLQRDGREPQAMVPVMSNTYYPPNQPTPARCYALGEALRQAIESWDVDARVAVIASGGLSHVVIDEELDRTSLDALLNKDKATLCGLPVEKLDLGTSEIRNWVAAGAVLEKLKMTLVDYVPCYRSLAGTGCGMAFAYWT